MKVITYNKFLRIGKKAIIAVQNIPESHCRQIIKTRAKTFLDLCETATESRKQNLDITNKEVLIVYSFAKNLGNKKYKDYYREFKLIKGKVIQMTNYAISVVMSNGFTLMLRNYNVEAVIINPPDTIEKDCQDLNMSLTTTAA